jgi:hypothetical protein
MSTRKATPDARSTSPDETGVGRRPFTVTWVERGYFPAVGALAAAVGLTQVGHPGCQPSAGPRRVAMSVSICW